MTDQTPSPQSVVVPVIRLTTHEVQSGHDRQKWAEGLIRQLPEDHDGRNSWLINYGETEEASDKRNAWNDQARKDGREPSCVFNEDTRSTGTAAPAPSSLAGGEVNDNPLTFGMGALVVNTGKFGGDNAVFIARAKEPGEVGAYTGKSAFDRNVLQPGELVMIFPTAEQAQVVADALVGALTPRHEAPAEDPVPSEWTGQGTDADFFTPAKTAFSTPAEGAGERAGRLSDALIRMIEHFERVDAPEADRAIIQYASKAWAQSARSSAPEAREGLKPQVRPMEDTLSAFGVMKDHFVGASSRPVTHPAAPSADKLRIALSEIRDGMVASRDCISVDDWIELADEALSTPDALKGDAK